MARRHSSVTPKQLRPTTSQQPGPVGSKSFLRLSRFACLLSIGVASLTSGLRAQQPNRVPVANGQEILKVSAKNDASRSERKTTELGAASSLARLRQEPNQKTAALIIKLQRGSIEEVSRAIHGLHALGKKAIPSLIDSISSDRYVANLLRDPTSSYIQDGSLTQFACVRSAYVIELILAQDKLPITNVKKTSFVLGPQRQNYLYSQAVIVKEDKQPISRQDLPRVKDIYERWWEVNEGKSMEDFRKDWNSGRRPLTNSGFSWDSVEGVCSYWQSTVEPRIAFPQTQPIPELKTEQQRLRAIECLLALQGDKNPSSIRGATSPRTSQVFDTTPVEVAALYYISYLYYEKWDHAQAAVLVNENAVASEKDTIETAYIAYRAWYEKIKVLGIKKAKDTRLDPLDDTGIRWY